MRRRWAIALGSLLLGVAILPRATAQTIIAGDKLRTRASAPPKELGPGSNVPAASRPGGESVDLVAPGETRVPSLLDGGTAPPAAGSFSKEEMDAQLARQDGREKLAVLGVVAAVAVLVSAIFWYVRRASR